MENKSVFTVKIDTSVHYFIAPSWEVLFYLLKTSPTIKTWNDIALITTNVKEFSEERTKEAIEAIKKDKRIPVRCPYCGEETGIDCFQPDSDEIRCPKCEKLCKFISHSFDDPIRNPFTLAGEYFQRHSIVGLIRSCDLNNRKHDIARIYRNAVYCRACDESVPNHEREEYLKNNPLNTTVGG